MRSFSLSTLMAQIIKRIPSGEVHPTLIDVEFSQKVPALNTALGWYFPERFKVSKC